MTEESIDLRARIIATIALHVGEGKSSRWEPCKEFLHIANVGKDVSAKKYSMYKLVHPADPILLNKLSDDKLLKYFELVIRRVFIQM